MLGVLEIKRFFVRADGTPFIYAGGTAWELFHRLNREDAAFYLEKHSAQRFTVIQAVLLLAELDGLAEDNAHGDVPLRQDESGAYEPSAPADNPGGSDYWQHVDYIVQKASSLGLVI